MITGTTLYWLVGFLTSTCGAMQLVEQFLTCREDAHRLSHRLLVVGVLESPSAHIEFAEPGVSKSLGHHGYLKHQRPGWLLPVHVSTSRQLIAEQGQTKGYLIE